MVVFMYIPRDHIKQVSVGFPAKLWREVQTKARVIGISASEFVRYSVSLELERLNERKGKGGRDVANTY